jgi:hypothetical protein
MQKKEFKIETTGDLRTLLANSAKGVMNGDMEIDRANALHKIAKNISDSLYSETKIAMFRREADLKMDEFGAMRLGNPTEE